MSKISKEEVANLAKLARLDLAESELDEYAKQLEIILDFNDFQELRDKWLTSKNSSSFEEFSEEALDWCIGEANKRAQASK